MIMFFALALASAARPNTVWHLPARCEEGDVNALFQFGGTWHLMQQWAARPHTSVGHAVSTDLLHWSRLPDVLASGLTADEQCYDGSASLVMRSGVLTPMLMIDGGCGEKGPGARPCMESSGNGSTGGVTAFPDDLSDTNLTRWTKTTGPTVFEGCDGSAGPSPIIRNPAKGKPQLIAIHGRGEALFEATSESLTSWTMVEPTFLPARGGGGGLWHALPPAVGSGPHAAPWSHIMQLDGAGLRDGGASFALLAVDASSSRVANLSSIAALDSGRGVVYGTLSASGGTADGGGGGDPRTLHVSWLASALRPDSSCGPSDVDVGSLTSFRELQFDPTLGPSGGLVERPIAEYDQLRGAPIGRSAPFNGSSAPPIPRRPAALFALPAGPSALDFELEVSGLAPGESVQVGVACRGAECGALVNLTLGGSPAAPTVAMRVTTMSSSRPSRPTIATATFPLPPEQPAAVPLRLMTDLGTLEVFAAAGRGVHSGELSFAACALAPCSLMLAAAGASPKLARAAAWPLGSIF